MGIRKRTVGVWGIWLLASLALAGWLGLPLLKKDTPKTAFIPGAMTHGHHQIELQCGACHGDGFNSQEVLQDACVNCHGDELKAAQVPVIVHAPMVRARAEKQNLSMETPHLLQEAGLSVALKAALRLTGFAGSADESTPQERHYGA